MYKKKGAEKGSNTVGVEMVLSSGFDEFEFKTNLPLECILENECISEEEYREIWVNTPKDEHVTYDIKMNYAKVVEGRHKGFGNC